MLNGGPLKLIDKFTYIGSCIKSTESDVKISLAKALTDISGPSNIWKSDLCDKIKRGFFQTTVWVHHNDPEKMHKEKHRRKLHKNATRYIEQILETTPHEITAIQPLTSHL